MTTTLRPKEPLRTDGDGARSRGYEICVNGRPVGLIEIGTDPGAGPGGGTGRIRSLRVEEAPDRRRGRGTVAVLAAEEVLRGWGCGQVRASVPADALPALRMAESLGYRETGRTMLKDLPDEPAALPADVEGRSMNEAEYQEWAAGSVADYAQNWIDRGVPAEQALATSETVHRDLLPHGLATPDTSINVLVHEGEVAGHVWVGRREVRAGEAVPYVYDVRVAEGLRGRGFGRALMLLAERVAHESGSNLLGLHVFADNTPALRLYESLQYVTNYRNFLKLL